QPKHDRADRAPNLPEDALVLRERSHGQRDHEGVVARQEQVQYADPSEPHEKFRLEVSAHECDAPAGSVTGRHRRHHGVMTGRMKKKIPSAVMTAAIGRVKKIVSEPCDMIRLCRSAFSARSPRTSASTSGASG